ncbi:MAG: bifunctional phosphoribosylaminoimidazolecarboxamide formyltransferase/IMP cyclohydrolase, partial [Bacteroidota bacterium]
MEGMKKIRTALISVYYKDGLEPIVRKLNEQGVKLFSTGGTQTFIEEMGIAVTAVESLTSYPSILGGRVKTLHPKVFGGILARRELQSDLNQLAEYEIPELDLVIVDLYPFEATVASSTVEQEIIEKIDIGGISLIRAAAKNYKDVVIVASRDQYPGLLEVISVQDGATSLTQRRTHAAMAFQVSSHYDAAIFGYFNQKEQIDAVRISYDGGKELRYGENPHQSGRFFGNFSELFEQLHGKEISYNNLLDIDAAANLIAEFDEPSFAILKHTNACGVASRPTVKEAYEAALAGDPISAFGGILISNRPVDLPAAESMTSLFCE